MLGEKKRKLSTSADAVFRELDKIYSESPCQPLDLNHFHRFAVLAVEKQQKILHLKLTHIATNQQYFCALSGQWIHSEIFPADIVHMQSKKFENGTYFIDNQQGFITVNPDLMINSTMLSSSVFCMRKTWLSEKFKGWGFGNKYMLIGTTVHTLFQKACSSNLKTAEDLNSLLLQITTQNDCIMDCFLSNITVDQLISDVQAYIPSIVEWLEKYIFKGPGPLEDDPQHKIKVVSVVDIEENIWCPALGTKGKIDTTLEVEIHSKSIRKGILPLELKTGRPSFSFEHLGQISLYSMMMSNRDLKEYDDGLLLYLKDSPRMKLNQVSRLVSSSLLQKRNELAVYLNRPLSGPQPKDSLHSCSKCEHLLDCSLMMKSFQPELLSSTRVMKEELVPNALIHLSVQDIDFFKHWISLIQLELEGNKGTGNDFAFWSEPSEFRETKGLGLSNLQILDTSGKSIILCRSQKQKTEPTSLMNHCGDLTGERVAISLDENVKSGVPSKVAICIGFVLRMDIKEIEISLEQPNHKMDDLMQLRVDLLKYSQIYSINYDNILRLMTDDDQSIRLRNLVIHGSGAQFKNKFSKSIVEIAKRIIKPLNEQQQRAVLKVINTEDYLLIRGTPGSGKTTVIVAIVRMLIAMGRSILITSHTHAAVDNIMCKLKEHNVDFVRAGSEFKINPALKDYLISNRTKTIDNPAELKKFYSSVKVAAVTCLGVASEPLFEFKKFDYCLIDEASQVLLPTTLGPLFASIKFILVGDEKQLPPVVRSRAAKEKGLEMSLFSQLLSKESSSLQLSIQYRMNAEIQNIPSKLFYDDALKYGNQQVAQATLNGAVDINTGTPWLDQVLSCHISKSFLFLNTDQIDLDTNEYNGLIENSVEADLVSFIIQQLVKHLGLLHDQIGVISPYQRQVSLIKQKLGASNIFVNSVDQYQGKEKDCILVSFVKQSQDPNMMVTKEEILSDERRINVAITRASKKLILIGSKSTLQLYETFSRLFSLLRPDQIIDLPNKVYSNTVAV
ncbi:DNA replication ATP-dependent helicase/nuclease DNA2-like [Tetranychus urticae]|nr:DNA replication ATP-dependent helicase/nuclease DNA2-like [Tetranychus urticae]